MNRLTWMTKHPLLISTDSSSLIYSTGIRNRFLLEYKRKFMLRGISETRTSSPSQWMTGSSYLDALVVVSEWRGTSHRWEWAHRWYSQRRRRTYVSLGWEQSYPLEAKPSPRSDSHPLRAALQERASSLAGFCCYWTRGRCVPGLGAEDTSMETAWPPWQRENWIASRLWTWLFGMITLVGVIRVDSMDVFEEGRLGEGNLYDDHIWGEGGRGPARLGFSVSFAMVKIISKLLTFMNEDFSKSSDLVARGKKCLFIWNPVA